MPRTNPRAARTMPTRRKRRRARRGRWNILRRLLPTARTRRRWWQRLRRLRGLPGELRLVLSIIALAVLAVTANTLYQVIRKPTELFFPVSGALHKTPQETWRAYGKLFRRHSTPVLSPELLAALAQVEGSGNPVARTYWRMSLGPNPFDIYRPASSAVGMYQITDGTFEIARRFCIRDHRVIADGPWNDPRSCWFNGFYSRVIPSHAVEMTAAYLDHQVSVLLARHGRTDVSIGARRRLAAVIHLCGAGAGAAYVRRGLAFAPGQRCGSHDPRRYVAKVEAMQRTFAALHAQ